MIECCVMVERSRLFPKASRVTTPQKEIELIRARLRWAEHLYTGKAKEG